ncbi:MAG: ATP-binding cassette domain-containing protein [Spirochaetales bacterium]
MAVPALSATSLSKSYTRGERALDDFSLVLAHGEIVGLLGENGAGKTTALRILSGLLAPDAGSVSVAGCLLSEARSRALREIGVLFGAAPGLYERLSGRENIEYFARLQGLSAQAARSRTREICALLQMEQYVDARVATYSTGMRQKTALARSVVHEPRVLLFDEPTSGLDVTATDVIHEFLLDQRERGRAILFSSHAVEEVERLCDRVIILAGGATVARAAAFGDAALFRDRFKALIGARP